MWKKILIGCVMILTASSLAYAYCSQELNAATSIYHAGGNVTGRVNIAPSEITASTIGMQKGDKILMGTRNPLYNTPITWILLKSERYNDYGCTTAGSYCNKSSYVNGWFSMTTQEIANTYMGLRLNDTNDWHLYINRGDGNDWYGRYANSNIYNNVMKPFNDSLLTKDKEIVAPRNLKRHHDSYLGKLYSGNSALFAKGFSSEIFVGVNELGNHSFLPDTYAIINNNTFSVEYLDSKDSAFPKMYWSTSMLSSGEDSLATAYAVRANGTVYIGPAAGTEYEYNATTNSIINAVRPAVYLNMDKTVFAVSPSNTTGLGKVSVPTLPNSYSKILDSATGSAMKVRIENSILTNTTSFTNIQDSKHNIITKSKLNSTVYLNANGKAGNDGNGGTYTISAIIFDQANRFSYYIPLEAAKGSGLYELNLSGIPVGAYKIGIVNEAYNENSTAPADSSRITAVLPLEIVGPHKITYMKQPQSGASSGIDYEFSKNVSAGQTVGKITVNPQGIMINYTLEGNGDNTYQNFEIDGLNSDNFSNSSSLNVKIKDDAPDLVNGGLKAGTYKFCINTIDADGYPTTATSDSKVCTSFTVAKTKLSVAFDDPNTTKKSMADAATAWSETATVTPSTDTKITYSKTGGFSSLIEIDSETGQVTYNGNNAFNKVTIRATADDDPVTGNDNYDPVYVEKEIVIYRGVNGTLTPDTNSSDTTTPTFTASQANVKGNGVIGTVQGTEGTPDTIGGTQTTYRYEIINGQDSGMFQITTGSNKGTIKVKAGSELGVGSYHFTVRVSDNWSSKDVAVTVNVGVAGAENLQFYETSAAINMISQKSVTATDTGVTVFATVKGSTNTNPVKYKIKDGSTNVIEINENSGAVTIHGVGTVTIVAEKQGATGQANAYAELTFTVTAGAQNFIYTDNAGNELPKSGSNYSAKKEVYAPNKTFQLYTAGNPTGTTVTYQLKSGSPTDVISVDSSGLVTILNASLTNQMGKVIVQATSYDPSGNYDDKTIELPINIEKGTRTIAFAENPIYVTNGKGKVTPVTEVDGVTDTDGDVLIEVNSNEDHTIAWTNDNKNIDYNYSGDTGKDIKIHATKPMDRNYKAAEANGTIHIMGPDENILAITSPGQIIYGDHFTIRSSQYDADSTNVQYTFIVDGTTYISNPTVNGNSAEFDALKFSGTNKTTITVTRTADGEVPLSKKVQVTVLPKPIEIIIDDKEKLKGEQNPTLTYQDFRTDLVSWNGVQDVIQENDIKLSTTARADSSAGSYPIKGDANSLNKTYPNYSFTFKEGTLTITEENIEDDWYHLELDDGNNTAYTGNWINKDVNIISDHTEYINLSLDQSTWNPNYVTVTKEGESNQSFWMKKDSGAITKEKQEIIRIDKTAPKVKGIKAKDTNNKLQDIINKLSGGIFFKPGTSFEITTDDSNSDLKVSGTKEIAYKVYKIDKVSRAGDELIKDGSLTVSNEKASITISETTGIYKVCVIPTDNAENTNTETCHEVELKKIDVDVDGDGKPDFNDPDGDGCPDLNIKWKDPNDENKWIVINGDRNYDGIPDLNIDSDGDGKSDLNIDTDKDGKPDLNLVILKKGDWKPTKCVKQDIDNRILEEYCTGTSVKAVINVDTDNDGIPNINIDTNGDMKADINIDTDNDLKANVNIAPIHSKWNPDKDYSYGKPAFVYDTVSKYEPLLNIDTDGDGRPDINLDINGDGVADINIDTDGDWIPNINIDSTGDGKPDINIDLDDDGKPDENIVEIKEWKPNKNVDGDILYDTMDFTESNKPSDPDKPTEPNTDVQGNYFPGNNVGGAITGDNTDLMLTISLMLLGLGIMSYQLYRYKKDTFQ